MTSNFCKKSPNGEHLWRFIGIIVKQSKEYEFYTCDYCGANLEEPV